MDAGTNATQQQQGSKTSSSSVRGQLRISVRKKKQPSWQIPKAEYSPETYAVVSSVNPSALLPNAAVSTWSKDKAPRFGKTVENPCTTQYDLNRADK